MSNILVLVLYEITQLSNMIIDEMYIAKVLVLYEITQLSN